MDSIKFGSGNVVVNTPSSALSFSISGIDSVLFLNDLSSEVADSIIRIHYAGSAVEIQNPYENISLNCEVSMLITSLIFIVER